jgi:hypothetical protein
VERFFSHVVCSEPLRHNSARLLHQISSDHVMNLRSQAMHAGPAARSPDLPAQWASCKRTPQLSRVLKAETLKKVPQRYCFLAAKLPSCLAAWLPGCLCQGFAARMPHAFMYDCNANSLALLPPRCLAFSLPRCSLASSQPNTSLTTTRNLAVQ